MWCDQSGLQRLLKLPCRAVFAGPCRPAHAHNNATHPAPAGRDVVLLVENLRKSLPPNMAVLQRIMALEQVAAELTDR